MPVWVKLSITFIFLNILILGTGVYSANKLSRMADSIDLVIHEIEAIKESVNNEYQEVKAVDDNLKKVNGDEVSGNKGILAETSALSQEIYDKPLQSINFARAAQNNFTNLDLMIFKAFARDDLAKNTEKIEEQLVLFKEDFEIAIERAISPNSKDTIKVIQELVIKWEKIKNHIMGGKASYGVIEPVSEDIQVALAELVEFEAGAGLDYVIKVGELAEKAKDISDNMKASVERVAFGAKAIADASAAAEKSIQESSVDIKSIKSMSKVLNIVIFLASIAVVLFLAYDIGRPVRAAQVIATNITKGKLDNKISSKRRDEFGKLLNAMNQMQNDLKQNMEIESKAKKDAQDNALASQNRQVRVAQSSDKLSTEVTRIMEASKGALENLQGVANSLSSTASRSKDSSEHVIVDIREIRDAVTTIAAAVEEMSASFQEISTQTKHSAHTAQEAAKQAGEAKDAVESLSEMSNRVGDIVQMINDIAEQTNLLALNATIESARAGEAGKGFAVVANEVKSLATETASATEQISEQIRNVQTISKQCVLAIQAIIETIGKIRETSLTIEGSMGDQEAATAEIAMQTQRTSARMDKFVGNINTMASGVDVVHKSSSEVLSSIEFIKDEMETMDQNIKSITDEIRKVS